MMCKLFVFSVLALIGASVGQILQSGTCDANIPLHEDFDIDQFLGTWYEYAVTDHPQGGDCSTIQFTRTGNTFGVNHRIVKENFLEEYQGTASVVQGTARISLNLPTISTTPLDFWVMNTDYENFALVYRCENVGTTERQIYVWQLSRATSYASELIPALMNTTMNNVLGFDSTELREIDHSDQACYVLPVIEAGQPVILEGQCDPNIPVVQNFDAGRFLGVWHGIAGYYSENNLGTCGRAQYTSEDGVRVDVINSEVINQNLFTIEGYATVIGENNSGRLNVVLEVAPGVTAQSELLVIATDYEQWAVSYTCTNLENNRKRVFSWIASRTRTLPPLAQSQVNDIINSILELNNRYYQLADQSNDACFYFPEASDEPAVFGGQCDLTIPVVQQFNAGDYLGLWHDIESYPTPFQFGTCSNAFYSIGSEGVDVFNTQVVNETLDTINGVAVPVGNEGKLVVTFPILGTELTIDTDYWIISTDYSTYSLVYSCTNINDYQQQITVWKLSRTKALTAAANTAINAAMASISVLDQRYFRPVDQTPAGCFYYPEPVAGETVVFPGSCENVPVVSNFNINDFSGTWYEAQAYPKEPQSGQCISHQFTSTGTALTFQSSSVDDQLLSVTSGRLAFLQGTDARFTLTVTVNETTEISFPYSIVATDYSNYALAYSCVQIDEDFRAIYSWKLSRTPQLSVASNTAIDAAMTNIQTMANEYFESVDQSSDACFYFPDLAPGAPVILPGQCDPNIPVVTNFNASGYLGRWRLIESYPSDNQDGQCNQANYSLNDDGTILVYNTEVLNQALVEAFGVGRLLPGQEDLGKISVTFPEANEPFELWILDTDYDSYSLVYGCVNINNDQRRVWSWKMSRTTTLSAEAVTAINAVTDRVLVLNDRYYQSLVHSDAACFYYPEPNESSTVIFRGQCDETLPVVMQFDPVGYMGLWHDIERYPAPFQDGTCGNAFYTLDTTRGVVDVYNTQVINQTLDTINGEAVLDLVDENDTSAKLLVTFPVGGFELTTPYWVLATDYISYALVYSCSNIDDEYRSVTSWKLSRTKSLTAAANTAMNAVINSVDVLDQRYYITQDQTPAGCFYFPEPQPGVPVVFPGQCELNIPVMQVFDMSRFQGTWHEIEAYPKIEQDGQCVNHAFTLNGNVLAFESFNVIAESLGITTGTVRFSANDNSGRLTLAFTSGNTVIEIPFWVIDTDYDNYALVYSCVNQDIDHRGVWSWKLSRSKELSNAANAAIDQAMADITTLDNVYYEPIEQTDEACFYLPDLNLGDPVIFPGQCDTNITGIQNFNAAGYLGRWRLIETYPSEFQLGTCGDATYSLNDDGSILVYNTEVVNQALSTIIGSAVLASDDGTGKLLVTFPDAPVPFEYYILDTDYDNYALVYSCTNINSEQRRVYSWKLSRTNTLSQAAVAAINQVVDRVNVLNARYYQTTQRSDAACFYFPEPNESASVIFRGQCDETLPVVMQFNPVDYMGLWHDIERYPAPFQDGTCGNAFYTLDTTRGVVDVYNTQVINQTLDTIDGEAVLDLVDENDTSAKLLVTFPVGGFNLTTPYWVLTTDYFSYALVYSCSNIDEEYRSVTSWKLSRTKSLTPAANAAINSVINFVDVLDQRYYITQDQTPAGCFYFPEPQPGVPVVFPGQCDLNFPVVQNFNMASFQGTWHEIEAYPKDDQPGQCINHQFTLNAAGSLNFQSSNVFAQALGITTGTASFSSNDNSGRLNLVFTSNGTPITIPYWIVDTDYNNYALAYSCVNQGSDFRGVWSWKLSRTKELSPASSNAIDAAIANLDVIDNVYFEPVNQTDDSCFYLPDLAPGEPVIFPGQCDTNIPVVENFDAGRYLGRWRLIETYPSEFQLGTCGDATYSTGDGVVDVYNTEVIGQSLSTINGTAVLAGDVDRGILTVTFPDAPPIDYYILDTDYDSYSLVYSCLNINSEQRRVFSWKLSRANTLSQAATNAINNVINTINVLDNRYYQNVDRSDAGCFYYPEPNGNPVIFRGQCDQNVNVVTGFDAIRYQGTWYNIESYPAPFQGGTCGTATYTLNLETLVVFVENTQVVNQVLDVQIGTAVLATDDGSAKLLVTFDVNGVIVTTDYWVLATDYDNFALVYSCQNIDDEYRQVNSFKLSRSKTITAAGQTAITAAINQVQVLDERYFEDGRQSEEDCFYYPDNNGGDVVLEGQCVPDNLVPVMTNFNANSFSGTWHEVARFPSDLQEGECSTTQYSVDGQNSVTITQTEVKDELQTANVIPGSLAGDGRAVINFNIEGVPINAFYILDTNYNEYALVYGCRNLENATKQVYSWKLSRSRGGLSLAANNRIDELVSTNIDLFEGYYSYTSQTNDSCFYYPQYDELPEAIELFGPCDNSIRGVAGFNAEAYLGRWIEIAKYPEPNQFGTCDRAYYSPLDDIVSVRNTQVVNQTLAEQLGFARVASFDGTGELWVTFVVNGVTVEANYYVLATDYQNYALVYSCRNLANGNRQVSSWKLSRTTTLTPQAIQAIDAVIEQTQGLSQDYYQETSQSEEDCFYIPTVDENAAPVFRGQCEAVSGMNNFNAELFEGWWHEIERYPVDDFRGECISSWYQAVGAGYQVIDTVVVDGVGQTNTDSVEVTADGRLRRIVNGVPQDVWVLDTDYENYALLYSCENVDSEYRRVWSAKHSKNRQLTDADQNAMAPTIAAHRLLYPQFYQRVDQSDAACFHYPPAGQQVILPGQCDEDIPVVQNFDVAAYGGTWYQIARYPQLHENPTSTCIGARYVLDEAAGVVEVLNWEVIDGVLETIEGTATITSDDGSAKLSVELPRVGTNETVTTSLYVLATDYESYSLAYSCSNYNRFQRTIGVWQLSRDRTMSDPGTEAIAALINNRPELLESYFIQVAQDEDCEEPSSGAFLRSSVLVMVICALWQILS